MSICIGDVAVICGMFSGLLSLGQGYAIRSATYSRRVSHTTNATDCSSAQDGECEMQDEREGKGLFHFVEMKTYGA